MMRTTAFVLQLFVLCVVFPLNLGAAPPENPDKDPRLLELLQDARQSIGAKKPDDAIKRCDQVLASFKAYYGGDKQKTYCARTSTESLKYLLVAAHDQVSAVVLSSVWADAYFVKGYALLELGRIPDAKASLQQAIALSPSNSHYLSELGTIYQMEKNWAKAKQQFEASEENAGLSPESVKADEIGRARRGLGYVFVELGELDKAEKKYQQCLADNPNDTRAKRELEYVRSLRAKKRK